MAAEVRLHHRYPLRRGGSLGLPGPSEPAQPSTQLVTLQFKFKPASVDRSRRGEVVLDAAGGVRASFTPEGEEAEGVPAQTQRFHGVASREGGEFVLLAENRGEETGFRLERVSTSVLSLLHERGAEFEARDAVRAPRKSRKIVLPTQRRARQPGGTKKPRISESAAGESKEGTSQQEG